MTLDPQRAPMIEQAFRLYATGDWTCGTLADYLQAQGLDNPATGKYPARPVGKKQLYANTDQPLLPGSRHIPRRRIPRQPCHPH